MPSEQSGSDQPSEKNHYTTKVVKGAAILAASKGGSYLLAFLSTIIIARLLSPEDFGIIAVAMAVIGVSAALFDLPVTQALIALEKPTDSDFNTAWTIAIIRSLIVMTIVFALAHPIADFFGSPQIADIIIVMAFQQIIFGLRNPYFERFARVLDYSKDAWAEIISKVMQVIVSIAIAIIWKSYWALVAGSLVAALTSLMVTYIVINERPAFSLKSFRQLFGFSFWLALSAVTNRLQNEMNQFIAIKAFGAAVLGQISVGKKLSSEISQFLLVPIVRSLYSAFSRFSNEAARLRQAYLMAQTVTFAAVMPIGVGLGLVAEFILPALLGDKWDLSVTVVQFIAPTIGIMVLSSPIRAVCMALNQTRVLFYRDLISLLIQATGMIVGTYYFGFIGFLAAFFITSLIVLFVNLRILGSLIGVSILAQLFNVLRSIIAGLSMTLVIVSVKTVVEPSQSALSNIALTAMLAALGALTYFFVHCLVWLMQKRPDGIETFIIKMIVRLKRKRPAKTALT